MKKILDPIIIISFATLLIFVLDFAMPPGAAIGVLYLVPMTIAFKQKEKIIICFAVISTLLIIIDGILFYEIYLHYTVYIDRVVSIIAIWLASFVAIRYRELKIKSDEQIRNNLKATMELIFMTSHNMRKPICSLQGLSNLLQLYNQSPKDLKKISEYMKGSVIEIDSFTKELTLYLGKIKEQHLFEIASENHQTLVKSLNEDAPELMILNKKTA